MKLLLYGISMVGLLALVGIVQAADPTCNTCQDENEIICLNSTTYQICMNGQAVTTRTYHCRSGFVCSNTNDICVDETTVDGSQILDVCGAGRSDGNGSCGVCPTDPEKKYVCVSQTQYARCVKREINPEIVISCAAGEICVQEALTVANKICVPKCAADFLSYKETCTEDVYSTTTTTAAPVVTPSPDVLKKACRDEQAASNPKSYFYTRNPEDHECRSYVYCESAGSDMIALYLSCRSGLYYDLATKTCQRTKPTNCTGTSSPTTTTTTTTTTSTTTTTTTPRPPESSNNNNGTNNGPNSGTNNGANNGSNNGTNNGNNNGANSNNGSNNGTNNGSNNNNNPNNP